MYSVLHCGVVTPLEILLCLKWCCNTIDMVTFDTPDYSQSNFFYRSAPADDLHDSFKKGVFFSRGTLHSKSKTKSFRF